MKMPSAAQQTLVTVTPNKWQAAVKFLMGRGPGSELEARERRTLKQAMINGEPLTTAQAAQALKRLGWQARYGRETEFLNSVSKQREWEEAIFYNATHFTVFRLDRRHEAGTRPRRESVAYHTFPEAVAEAANDPAALVYAVTAQGNNFCIPRSEWDKYKEIWSER